MIPCRAAMPANPAGISNATQAMTIAINIVVIPVSQPRTLNPAKATR